DWRGAAQLAFRSQGRITCIPTHPKLRRSRHEGAHMDRRQLLTRISSDASGESRFDELEIRLRGAGEIGRLSEAFDVRSVIFRETDPDYDYDWHLAPQRQLIVLLDGVI